MVGAGSILLVEDEDALRDSLQRVLSREGYSVEGVRSSEDALRVLHSRRPDVIISDIVLPGMDGIEFMRKCREMSPGTPVIIMTAFASIESAVRAMKDGAFDYLVKPVIHDQVKDAVRRALLKKT